MLQTKKDIIKNYRKKVGRVHYKHFQQVKGMNTKQCLYTV